MRSSDVTGTRFPQVEHQPPQEEVFLLRVSRVDLVEHLQETSPVLLIGVFEYKSEFRSFD